MPDENETHDEDGLGIITVRMDPETGEVYDDDGDPLGRTLEDIASDGVPINLLLNGTQEQLTMDVTADGETPSRLLGSSLVIKKCEVPLSGQFPIGGRAKVTLEVEIQSVNFARIKASGIFVGLERVHTGEIVDPGT